MPSVRALLLTCAFAACSSSSPASDAAPLADADAAALPAADAARDARPDAPLDTARERVEPDGLRGPVAIAGCADGTREGFRDFQDWPKIAGCSGAWNVPGLLDSQTRQPQCGREGGNDGKRPDGIGCSVADLCAEGWHVCQNADEVDRSSLSGCESAALEPEVRLFVVRAGASPMGVCFPDPEAANDLHGCGTTLIGASDTSSCFPLVRRMGFAECRDTGGVWACGGPEDHLREAAVVVKTASDLGGVLCCHD
jgi:hypothetical protein